MQQLLHYAKVVTIRDIQKKESSNETIRESIGIRNVFTFLYCGRIIKSKGLDILSMAADKIKDDLQIVVVGGSRDVAEEVYTGPLFGDKFVFVPFQQKESLQKYYQAADVFVLPTEHDAWGLVVGEAMANGLPVITTDKCLAGVAMIKQEENGYIFRVNDVEDLMNCMKKVMKRDISSMCEVCNSTAKEYALEMSTKDDIENMNKILKG